MSIFKRFSKKEKKRKNYTIFLFFFNGRKLIKTIWNDFKFRFSLYHITLERFSPIIYVFLSYEVLHASSMRKIITHIYMHRDLCVNSINVKDKLKRDNS